MAKKHLKLNKRIILIALGVILLLGAAIGLGVLTQQLLQPKNDGPTVSDDALNGGNPDDPSGQKTLPKDSEEIQNLYLSGDTQAAAKKINEILANPETTDNTRFRLYIQQGAAFKREGKLEDSLLYYKKALAIQQTQESYSLVARTAADLGKKEEAIDAYRNAIKLTPQGRGLGDSDRARYEKAIRELGGQP